ncbi:MAG: Na/Pi cotransporter family protein [Defluviitaleaceae bacterium]|nr:Na/Pi cotransporter family protein [Defluviitaleaceae bacterium]
MSETFNEIFTSTILVLGGLGLFLLGMRIMSTGLQTIAGDRLQGFLKKATSNRLLAVFVGIVATVGLNSSTASTVMTVSFVNSGLMNLSQAIGVIMGANVGTTLSAHLFTFRIDAYAPIFIFIGIVMYLFIKKKKVKNIGYVILGFGILFFGITTMGGPLREMGRTDAFQSILLIFENPFLALLAGFAFTAMVQSSTAATGVLVFMYAQGVPIPFETGAFIILGTNLGTSITTLIASIPANRASKRAALFHITFDIIGSLVFGLIIFFIPSILAWFQSVWYHPASQIAWFHTLYNFATLFLLLPFATLLARLMEKVIPVKEIEMADATFEKKLMYIDTKVAVAPPTAVLNAHMELCRMGKIAKENLAISLDAFFERSPEKVKRVFDNESVVNYLNHNIAAKLAWINRMELSDAEAKRVGNMFWILSDIERISDHAENIAEYAEILIDNEKLKFSDEAISELKTLGGVTLDLLEVAFEVYENQDESKLPQVQILEDRTDDLSGEYTENHVNRLIAETCEPRCGAIFTDMIGDLERSGDHGNNIAFSILPNRK